MAHSSGLGGVVASRVLGQGGGPGGGGTVFKAEGLSSETGGFQAFLGVQVRTMMCEENTQNEGTRNPSPVLSPGDHGREGLGAGHDTHILLGVLRR